MRKYISMLTLAAMLALATMVAVADDRPAEAVYQELVVELNTLAKQAQKSRSQEEVLGVFETIRQKLVSFRETYEGTPEAMEAGFQLGTLNASAGGLTQEESYYLAAVEYLAEYVVMGTGAERRNIAMAHYYLAESYKALGKFDDARAEYRTIITEFGDVDQQLTQFARSRIEDLDVEEKLAVGKEPLAFSVKSTSGETLSPSQFRGKVLLLDFWATWCRPCIAEMPHVKRVYEKYNSAGFEIVGISLDRSRASLDQFVESNGIKWPQYFDGKFWQNDIAMQYGVRSIPATYLIDRHGKIRYKSLRGAQLEKAVQKLLSEEI